MKVKDNLDTSAGGVMEKAAMWVEYFALECGGSK